MAGAAAPFALFAAAQAAPAWPVKTVAARAAEALPDHPWTAVHYMAPAFAGLGALVAVLGMGLISPRLLYTYPRPRDRTRHRMTSSA